MARHRFLLIPLFCTLIGLPVWSQDATLAQPAVLATPSVTCTPDGNKGTPDQQEMRQKLEGLPPAQRERILRNFKRMKDLPPDQKDYIRFINEQREKRLQKGVDDALATSGLKLDPAQRAKFVEIYTRERLQLEQQLRQESEKRRQELLPAMNQKVTAQYLEAAANGTPAPSPSPTPAK